VYGIIAFQLALTTVIALAIVLNPHVQSYLLGSVSIQISLMVLSLLGLIPLYCLKDRHPWNLVALGGWTAVMSTTIGLACTFYRPAIVIEAVALTGSIVAGLTVYTFYATKRGVEFTWMAPILFSSLWALIAWSFIQLWFPPGPVGSTIFSLLGAMIFSAYIVFDTHLLIQRFPVDEYIWAAVNLYLDIINLFMYILRMLGEMSRNN
jgi:protein lifeguard